MDVVIVTHNSEKWIERCIQSLYASKNREELNIYMVDNSSSDNTVCLLRECKNKRLLRSQETEGLVRLITLGHWRVKMK